MVQLLAAHSCISSYSPLGSYITHHSSAILYSSHHVVDALHQYNHKPGAVPHPYPPTSTDLLLLAPHHTRHLLCNRRGVPIAIQRMHERSHSCRILRQTPG